MPLQYSTKFSYKVPEKKKEEEEEKNLTDTVFVNAPRTRETHISSYKSLTDDDTRALLWFLFALSHSIFMYINVILWVYVNVRPSSLTRRQNT